MRALLRVLGLLIGVALAAAALLGPQAALDALATKLGLGSLTPLVQPPLGHNARIALAAIGLIFGLLLAFLLGRLARGRIEGNDARMEDVITGVRHGPAPSTSATAPDHAPRADPELADLPAGPIHVADLSAEPVPGMFAAAPIGSTDAPLYSGRPITVDPEPTRIEPIASNTTYMPTVSNDPLTPPEVSTHRFPAVDPEISESLARVEAAISALALHGPMPITARLDAIDARMVQIAQQIAELAGLARVASRTPLPAAPSSLPLQVRTPGDPALRQSIGTAARALRDRLERDTPPDQP